MKKERKPICVGDKVRIVGHGRSSAQQARFMNDEMERAVKQKHILEAEKAVDEAWEKNR